MGCGSWTSSSFKDYATKCSYSVSASTGEITDDCSVQELYKQKTLDADLSPYNAMRLCCDSEEHPETVPVILALDVTGSMGKTAEEIAKKLNVIMTKLFGEVKDIEFMTMGIGDLAYDRYPIQATQFESDIRIAEQLGKIYFEFGGGTNPYESYTAAWYFGLHNTQLDCWKRNKKGIIVTIGDEFINPILPHRNLNAILGSSEQSDVETKALYEEVTKKFDVYHIDISHRMRYSEDELHKSWDILGDHYIQSDLNGAVDNIIGVIKRSADGVSAGTVSVGADGISW